MEERVNIYKATEIIDKTTGPLDAEPVEVMLSGGRTLAERMSAWVDLPGADVSTLDGFAVRSEDLAGAGPGNEVELEIVGTASFINPFEDTLTTGQCIEVTTGSVIPESADAVVGYEDVEDREEKIALKAPVQPGKSIRKRAEEFRMGEFVAEAGQELTPGWIGLLVAAGYSEVNAIRPPRVTVITTGDEIKLPGGMIETGQVYASSGAVIVAWCRSMGVTEVRLVVAVDDVFDVQEQMPSPGVSDMVITLGGTGLSERDVVVEALEEMGADFLFKGMSVKPGHFTSYALLGNMPVLCLPGGPSGADAMFQVLGKRMVKNLMGRIKLDLPSHPAILAEDIKAHDDMDSLYRIRLEKGDDGITASPLSGSVHRDIAMTDGFVHVPAGTEIKKGERVPVWVSG